MTLDVRSLIDVAGGEIVGKVRLQKMVYLLERVGLETGFKYEYHHYGPYSAELSDHVDSLVIFGELCEEQRRRVSDGVPYMVYSVAEDHCDQPGLEQIQQQAYLNAIHEMAKVPATILELAATANWLVEVEGLGDWREELVARKGAKTGNGRTEKALTLLKSLKLEPGISA